MLNELNLESWCIYPDSKTFNDTLAFYFTSYNVKDEYNPYLDYNLKQFEDHPCLYTAKGWGVFLYMDSNGKILSCSSTAIIENKAGIDLGSDWRYMKLGLNLTTDELYILVRKILVETLIDIESLRVKC